MYICTLLSFYSMNNTYRSNLKRIRDLLLSNTIEDDHVAGEVSDSDNDSDLVPVKSDDTSTNEHINAWGTPGTKIMNIGFAE